ncbi:hypothetical protein J6S55_02335 [Candidatus Saccharibacteria bacterium]|nr:hypothetical protein [Candidatus Saccharibacteria bacterium]
MNWRKWLDDFVLAGKGILMATKEKRFWYGFVPAFIFFAMLINLLAGGFSKFELMAATGFSGTITILTDSFLSIFGINQIFTEWLPTFLLALLQGILVGLIVFLWQKKKESVSNNNSANVEKAGLITGLIALGAGCPTCGTTLLTPLLGAIFSTGSLAIAGAISAIVTILAVVIAILSLKRLGVEAYVIIANERYLQKQAKKVEKEQDGGKVRTNRKKTRKR